MIMYCGVVTVSESWMVTVGILKGLGVVQIKCNRS